MEPVSILLYQPRKPEPDLIILIRMNSPSDPVLSLNLPDSGCFLVVIVYYPNSLLVILRNLHKFRHYSKYSLYKTPTVRVSLLLMD